MPLNVCPDRRDFLEGALAFLSSVPVLVSLSRCGSSDTPAPGSVTGTVSSNHGHSAVITRAQLTGASVVELDITGSSGHAHTVSLAVSDLTSIQNGTQVAKTSSSGGEHTHTVTFN